MLFENILKNITYGQNEPDIRANRIALNTIFLCDILDLKWTIITASKAISITYCGSNNKDSINNGNETSPDVPCRQAFSIQYNKNTVY
jgi:hypothetical protein